MYYMLVLALAAGAYAAAPDYLTAYTNNLQTSQFLDSRINLKNAEGLNHLMLAVAIRDLASAVVGKPHAYPYIYESTVEAAINRVLKDPIEESRYLQYSRIQTQAVSAKVQFLVENLCLSKGKLLLSAVRCNELVHKAVKKNNLQQIGRLQLALGDAGHDYLGLAPKLDKVAKNYSAEQYLKGDGRVGLVELVAKVSKVDENL